MSFLGHDVAIFKHQPRSRISRAPTACSSPWKQHKCYHTQRRLSLCVSRHNQSAFLLRVLLWTLCSKLLRTWNRSGASPQPQFQNNRRIIAVFLALSESSAAQNVSSREDLNLRFLRPEADCFQVIWCELRDLGSSEPNQCKPNQSTFRQHLPKVYVQQFHGQDEDWFGIFWALLVHFRLGIIHKKGICQVRIFGFMRSKSSNLEVWTI